MTLFSLFPRTIRTRLYLKFLHQGKARRASQILEAGVFTSLVLKPTVEIGSADQLRKLLFSGVSLRSRENEHLLVLARNSKNSETDALKKMELLSSAGANIELLTWAIVQRDAMFFEFLLKHGADVNLADRNGLTPLQAAIILEEIHFEKALREKGAENLGAGENFLELNIINKHSLLSELNELLKWSLRNAGFPQPIATYPKPGVVRYRMGPLRLELEVFERDQVTLLLFEDKSKIPFLCLLPRDAVKLDSTTLRGHVVTVLKQVFQRSGNERFQESAPTKPAPNRNAEALEALGLSPGATEKEIIAAFRALAKRYHPDVTREQHPNKMVEINRAYEKLRS